VILAIIIGRTNLPLRAQLAQLALGPIYVSLLVLAFGWYVLYGPSGYMTLQLEQWFGAAPWDFYTLPGIGLLAGLAQVPLVFLYCSSSLELADSSLEDAARSVGAGPLRVVLSVTVPLLRPSILYSTVLTFVGSLEMLSIPLVFGTSARLEFFTTFLYREGIGPTTPDYGMLGAAAVMLLAIITLLVLLQGWLIGKSRRFVTVRGKASRRKLMDLGRWRWPVCALIAFYLLLSILLPLSVLVLRSFVEFLTPLVPPWEFLTFGHFQVLAEQASYLRSIGNSILVSTIGAGATTLLVAVVAMIVHRSHSQWRRPLEFLAIYPRAVPGMVAGIGFFWVCLLVPGFGLLQGTIWILVIAFMMRNLPTAYGAVAPVMMQIGSDLDQSARVCGADWWTVFRRVVMPIARPALLASFVLVFISMLKEYASAVFLFAPGSEIIGTTMLQLWVNGDFGPVAALSVTQLALTAAFMAAARVCWGVRSHG